MLHKSPFQQIILTLFVHQPGRHDHFALCLDLTLLSLCASSFTRRVGMTAATPLACLNPGNKIPAWDAWNYYQEPHPRACIHRFPPRSNSLQPADMESLIQAFYCRLIGYEVPVSAVYRAIDLWAAPMAAKVFPIDIPKSTKMD